MTWFDGRSQKLAFWAILILGSILRFLALERQSLWWDEAWQFYISSAATLPAMFDRYFDSQVTANPPFYHLVSFAFLRLGQSDFMVRLPSVVFGVLGLVLVYRLGARMGGMTTGLWAMAVMATSPFHLYYSQEARMYSQLMVFAMASTLLLMRAVERPTFGRWSLYTLATLGAIYTHVWTSLGILSQAIWILLYHRRVLWRFAACALATVILFVPMVSFFLQRLGTWRVPYGGAGSTAAALPYSFFVYSVGFSLGPSVRELRESRTLDLLAPHAVVVVVVAMVVGGLLVMGVRGLCGRSAASPLDNAGAGTGRKGSDLATLALLGLLVPVVGLFLASLLPNMTFNVRYTSWAFPVFCIIVGSGLATVRLHHGSRGWIPATALAIVFGASLLSYFTNPRYERENIRDAVAWWRERAVGEPFFSYNGTPTVDRYMTEDELSRHHQVWARSNTIYRIQTMVDVLDHPSACWIFLARDWHGIVEHFTRQAFTVTEEAEFPGGVKVLKFSTDRQVIPGVTEVPFKYERNQILVPVHIGDRGPLHMVLATGTGRSILDRDAALAWPAGSAEGVEIRLGDRWAETTTFDVADLSAEAEILGRRPDGVLGASVIGGEVVQIDYPRQLLRMARARPKEWGVGVGESPPSTSFPFRVMGEAAVPVIDDVEVDGRKLDLILDTGATSSLTLFTDVADREGLIFATGGTPVTVVGGRARERQGTTSVEAIRIGPRARDDQGVSVVFRTSGDVLGPDGYLGNGYLDGVVITLDRANRTITLTR